MHKKSLLICGLLACMLLLAACSRTPGDTSNTPGGAASLEHTVQVTETDYHIDAAITDFMPGAAYHFVVTNNGKTAHEFMIMPKEIDSMNSMQMSNMDKMALASISNINPGETRTLDYTFPISTAGTHPELACYLPGHYEAGMKQAVAVKA